MYVATKGPNVKWGAPISNGGAGATDPPAGDGPDYKAYRPRTPRSAAWKAAWHYKY